jgi:hypothetical protein
MRWAGPIVAVLGLLIVGAVGVAVVGGSADEPDGCLGPARLAAYEWRTESWRNPAEYGAVLDELSAACADRIYIDLTRAALTEGAETDRLADDVRVLASQAEARGIEVGAVAGDPWWPTTPENPDVEKILAFVAGLQQPDGPLVAVHLDTEPWGLDEWHTERERLTIAFIDYVQFVEVLRDELALEIPLGHLLPYWFDGTTDAADRVVWNGVDAYPFDHVGGLLGADTELVIMAYRNRADGERGVVALAAEELAAAARSESFPSVSIGLEVGEVEPATITFYGSTHAEFVREARAVVDATGVPEIVVNDAEALVELPRVSAPS